MLGQARTRLFRLRVNWWSNLTGHGPFDWEEFERRLEAAEYRRCGSRLAAVRSVGWAGRGEAGGWLFGVAGWWLPVVGSSARCHELFHAAQDFKTGLFGLKPHPLRSVVVEFSAHFWGGPLIGIPFAFVPVLFILLGLISLVMMLLGAV
ncbi:MAG: hypothetical protein ACRC33_30220 [Gemmataceae bacterium]